MLVSRITEDNAARAKQFEENPGLLGSQLAAAQIEQANVLTGTMLVADEREAVERVSSIFRI